jgi:hypothetical protein
MAKLSDQYEVDVDHKGLLITDKECAVDIHDTESDDKDPNKVRRKLATVSKLTTMVLGPMLMVLQIIKLVVDFLLK